MQRVWNQQLKACTEGRYTYGILSISKESCGYPRSWQQTRFCREITLHIILSMYDCVFVCVVQYLPVTNIPYTHKVCTRRSHIYIDLFVIVLAKHAKVPRTCAQAPSLPRAEVRVLALDRLGLSLALQSTGWHVASPFPEEPSMVMCGRGSFMLLQWT